MPALLSRLHQRFPRRVLIWATLSVLMGFGVLGGLYDLAGVPAQETMRANSEQQRVIIDPKTGMVSGLSNPDTEKSPFDVADDEQPAQVNAPSPEEVPAQQETPPAPPQAEPPASTEPTATPEPAPEGESSFEDIKLDRAEPAVPVIARSKDSLVGAPAPEISEKVGNELLPASGAKGATASSLYIRAFTRTEDQHLVSIIVTDVGFNGEVLKQVLKLPNTVTVGFSPYADQAARQIEALRNQGHEVWAMLPMMGSRYPQDDPGPYGLINALTIKSALERLHTVMANTLGSVGFIFPADETFSKHADLWNPIRDEIDTRGLYMLSTHPTRDVKELTRDDKQREHFRRADMILDSTPGAAFMRSKLESIRDLASKQTELVVLVSARPQTIRLLNKWLKTDPLNGVATLAPLSAIYVPYKAAEPPKEEESGGHGGGEAKEEGHGATEESAH